MRRTVTDRFKPWQRIGVYGIVAILTLLLVLLLFASFWKANEALVAESHLHAVINTIEGCRAYIKEHPAAWPRSWAALQAYLPYPESCERDCVVVDFGADPIILANQNWDSFTGIVVHPPVYDTFGPQLRMLINELRDSLQP